MCDTVGPEGTLQIMEIGAGITSVHAFSAEVLAKNMGHMETWTDYKRTAKIRSTVSFEFAANLRKN